MRFRVSPLLSENLERKSLYERIISGEIEEGLLIGEGNPERKVTSRLTVLKNQEI